MTMDPAKTLPLSTRSPATGSAVAHLRSLAECHVTVTTPDGQITGQVLSCSRRSVWLVEADEDFVVNLADILDVVVDAQDHAA